MRYHPGYLGRHLPHGGKLLLHAPNCNAVRSYSTHHRDKGVFAVQCAIQRRPAFCVTSQRGSASPVMSTTAQPTRATSAHSIQSVLPATQGGTGMEDDLSICPKPTLTTFPRAPTHAQGILAPHLTTFATALGVTLNRRTGPFARPV